MFKLLILKSIVALLKCGYYRKSAKVCVKNVHFLNVRVKKYSRSGDSYVLQCILLKTFVRLMFAVLAIRELFLTVNFCRFTVFKMWRLIK